MEGANSFITLRSSGPDRLAGTEDDFEVASFRRPYFAPLRKLIADVLQQQPDFPATEEEFARLLRTRGLLLEGFRDPWGSAYRASVQTYGTNRQIDFVSAGPDRQFDTPDDVPIANFNGTYFRREAAAMLAALGQARPQPQTVAEFAEVMRRAGLDISQYRDPWSQPYRLETGTSTQYGDRVTKTTARSFGGTPETRTATIPVTQKFLTFTLNSKGPDGVEKTSDDFAIVRLLVLASEEAGTALTPPPSPPTANVPGTGRIIGVVTDPSGATIPNVTVTLTSANHGSYQVTGADGAFLFAAIPPGFYDLTAECDGFTRYLLSHIPVSAGKATDASLELGVGSVNSAVLVEAAPGLLQSSQSAVSVSGTMATPRVRDYFPETLLWLPELLTDSAGEARAEVKLADSVTTWKIAAIASTVDGRSVEAESDLRSFQPFFLDFQPPPILTQGDQVTLPVTARNYQARAESVTVALQLSSAFRLLSSPSAKLHLPAGESAQVGFTVQAVQSGKARVVAKQDAVEKSWSVHPDGQQIHQVFGDLASGAVSFPIAIPAEAIAGATRGELRVYPNLASLLLESANALLVVPHGGAEQTISAAYSNLIAWRFAQAAGISNAAVAKRALQNIQLGVATLRGFTNGDGGVAYWSRGETNVAVTAHALSFLVDASKLVTVDSQSMLGFVRYLEQHLPTEDLLVVSSVARSLAAAKQAGVSVESSALASLYHQLATATDQTSEPYLLANFVLAALASGDESQLGDAIERLVTQAHQERGASFWDLRRNSPFYGWGIAGRYETTGIVVSALSAWRAKHPAPAFDTAIRQGLVFLLRGRNASGYWYSPQATLRAMQALTDASLAVGSQPGGTLEVRVNRRLIRTLTLPTNAQATDPLWLDLPLSGGENTVTVQGSALALIRITASHWLPWSRPHLSPELRLAVTYDRMPKQAGEPVRCTVKAERVGFRGYGMMIAEIGLPPGAEVDRASLVGAKVDHYEVLPDRVIFYLWPKAGGVTVDFGWTPRLAIQAKSAPSALYDYNNPEARAELEPIGWKVE